MAKSLKFTGVHFLAAAALLGTVAVAGMTLSPKSHATQITVHKSANCGCCGHWVQHLEDNGFDVTVNNTNNVHQVKRSQGVPSDLYSCHTATVGEYTVEGHVPASDIMSLLKDQPNVDGIGVAGMPMGSPGMDSGSRAEPYNVMAFGATGMEVYSSH